MFDPQVEALKGIYRLIRWDERCFGRTEEDGRPFSYWDSAADCMGLLDHLGIKSAIVGGMSQGGFLSLRAALKYPERVKGLILIDSQAGVDPKEQIEASREMLRQWTTLGPVDELVGAIASLILGEQRHWEPWVSRWKENPQARMTPATNCLLDRDDISSRLREITCPAIVFHGDADQAIPMSRAEALRDGLSGCKDFVVVNGAAHASNYTHADQVNPRLEAFLRVYA